MFLVLSDGWTFFRAGRRARAYRLGYELTTWPAFADWYADWNFQVVQDWYLGGMDPMGIPRLWTIRSWDSFD